MLRIHDGQMASFSVEAARDFEDRMIEHLGVLFPAYLETLGEEGARTLVRRGVERAATYGMIVERSVCIFIDAMFAFGRDFDRDPALPWAAAILTDTGASSPDEKAHRLFKAAFANFDQARGVFA